MCGCVGVGVGGVPSHGSAVYGVLLNRYMYTDALLLSWNIENAEEYFSGDCHQSRETEPSSPRPSPPRCSGGARSRRIIYLAFEDADGSKSLHVPMPDHAPRGGTNRNRLH